MIDSNKRIIDKRMTDALEEYDRAIERLAAAKREVTNAECAVANSVNAAGKCLVPGDAKPGEKFSIWIGSELYSVEKAQTKVGGFGDYLISKRPGGHVAQ